MNLTDLVMGAASKDRGANAALLPLLASGCATLLLASALAYVCLDTARRQKRRRAEEEAAAANGDPQAPHLTKCVDRAQYPGGQLTVYFGTQTGTAEQFARQLEREGPAHGFLVHVVDLEDVTVEDLLDDDRKDPDTGAARAVLLSSTYGEGEPPDNSTQFVQELSEKGCTQVLFEQLKGPDLEAPESCLVGLQFGVFGLGNKQYDNYNAMGKFYDHVLERLGGDRILPLGLGDDDADLEGDFENWKDNTLWPTLRKLFVSDQSMIKAPEANGSAAELPDCPYVVEYLADAADRKALPLEQVHSSNRHYFTAHEVPVKLVRELQSATSDESTLHVELDISNVEGLSYRTADNLGILPLNKAEVVEAVARALDYNLDQVFSLKPASGHDWHGALFPQPLTIRECLTRYCDLTSSPRRSELKLLAAYATDPIDRQFLLRLASKDGKKEYKEKITDAYVGLSDLLCLLPSIKIPLEHFLNITPSIQTRFYTISSSSSSFPNAIHLTVALTRAQKKGGGLFEGVCSGYLARCKPGDLVHVYIRPSTFRLPPEPSTPILMIGPGTGIAPMRALLQERSHQRLQLKQSVGTNTLYFGCRTRTHDYIYEDELIAHEKAGDLDDLFVAFSREQKEKIYVQHLLQNNAAQTWKLINDGGAYIYVCGGVRMGGDVSETLKEIFVSHGSMTTESAKSHLTQLSQKGRFIQELWA